MSAVIRRALAYLRWRRLLRRAARAPDSALCRIVALTGTTCGVRCGTAGDAYFAEWERGGEVARVEGLTWADVLAKVSMAPRGSGRMR